MPASNSDAPFSMRRSKLKAEEAALLAGELSKPSWESRNEGIHERVSFEDAIWGFDLAGGSFYKTPLRVTRVKRNSRAEKAGIRPGDQLLRINGIDTATLTIQEAHEIILESGIHIQLAVSAPEDEEDSYHCYEDPIETGYDSEEERRKEEEKARKRQVHARVSSYWSLQWPWVSKRRVIYRESNCFMVPSKFEDKHRELFPPQPMIRTQDDIVLHSTMGDKTRERKLITTESEGSVTDTDSIEDNSLKNGHTNDVVQNKVNKDGDNSNKNVDVASNLNGNTTQKVANGKLEEIPEMVQETDENSNITELTHDESQNSITNDNHESVEIPATDSSIINDGYLENNIVENTDHETDVANVNGYSDENPEIAQEIEEHSTLTEMTDEIDEDQIINEVLEKNDTTISEEGDILNSIINDMEVNNSESDQR